MNQFKKLLIDNGKVIWTLMFLCLCMSEPLWAAPTPATRDRRSTTEIKLEDLKGLSMYGMYDTADTMELEGSARGTNITGSANADSALGFGAEYEATYVNAMAIVLGGTYEMSRTLSRYSVSGGGQKQNAPFDSPKPQVGFWTLYGQGDLSFARKFNVFGGANYNFPQMKNYGGKWKGKLGYQFGASFSISNNFALDGVYRTLNFNGSNDDVSIDNFKMSGLIVRGRYLF